METIGQAAEAYQEAMRKVDNDRTYDSIDVDAIRYVAFRAGAEWAEKKSNHKNMCLRDRTKICNLCHECDVDVLNPNY